MNKIALLITASLFTVGIFSCKKKDDTPSNNAGVMVVNGCTGTGTIGVNAAAGGASINNASNMPFLRSSGYQNVTAGSGVAIAFTLNGVGGLTSGSLDLAANAHYTVFAGGSLTHPSFLSTTDDLTTVSGMAKVRFVNLSPDALNEKCYVGTEPVDSNVTANTATAFHSVTPATNTQVTMDDPATFPANLAQLNSVNFSAGKIYTVILTGTASSTTGAPALAITVIANN